MTYEQKLTEGRLICEWLMKQPQAKLDSCDRDRLYKYIESVTEDAKNKIISTALKSNPSQKTQLTAIKDVFKKADKQYRYLYTISNHTALVISFMMVYFDEDIKEIDLKFTRQNMPEKYVSFFTDKLLNIPAPFEVLSTDKVKALIAECAVQKPETNIIIQHQLYDPVKLNIALHLLGTQDTSYTTTPYKLLYLKSKAARLVIAPCRYHKGTNANTYLQTKDFTFITEKEA